VTQNSDDERAELGGHWEGLDRFLDSTKQPDPADLPPIADLPPGAEGDERAAEPPQGTGTTAGGSWAEAISAAYPIVPGSSGPDAPDPSNEDAAAFESWVPPWERSRPDAETQRASYSEDELALGRFAYADQDGEELPDPEAFTPGMSDAHLQGVLEAILMVVNEPVSPVVLAQVLEEPTTRVESRLYAMQAEYADQGRGFELRQVAGGWRFYTRTQYSSYVERFVLDGQQIRLTQAALETLAVVAYKQPVSRSRVAAIRGVNCDGVIKTLVTRGLVEECGMEAESGAHLYRTTTLFLEKVGINDVDELPSIAPFLPNDVDEFDLAQR